MTPLGQSHKLLHRQKGHDPCQHPQADDHVLHVIVTMVMVMAVIVVGVAVIMVGVVVIVVPAPMMVVRGDGVWDEVQEGVAQETPRGKAEQDLQEGGVVPGVLQRDAEEDKERGSTDDCSGDEGVHPQLPGGLEGGGKLQEEPPGGSGGGVVPVCPG